MREFVTLDLSDDQACSSAAAGPFLPLFEDWVAERSELWAAGPEIQQEMFMQMIRARLGG